MLQRASRQYVHDQWREVEPDARYEGMTELTRNGRSVQMRGTGPEIRKALMEYFNGFLL